MSGKLPIGHTRLNGHLVLGILEVQPERKGGHMASDEGLHSPLAYLMGLGGKILITLTWALTAVVLFLQGQTLLALATFFVPPLVLGTAFVVGSPWLIIAGGLGIVAFTTAVLIDHLAERRADRALDRRWQRAARARNVQALEKELGLDPDSQQ